MDEIEYSVSTGKKKYDKLSVETLTQIATGHFLRASDHPPMVILEDDQDIVTLVSIDNLPDEPLSQVSAWVGAGMTARSYSGQANPIVVALIYKSHMAYINIENGSRSDKYTLTLTHYDVLSHLVTRQLHEILRVGVTFDLRLWKTFESMYPDEEMVDVFFEGVMQGVNYSD